MEQYWKYISKNQNEVELAAIRKLLNSLKALDYVDKQLPKNTPSTPSKVCNLNSLELTSKKFSFEKWFTIID